MSDPYEEFREASAVGQPCFCNQDPCICTELIDQAEEWEADDECSRFSQE